MDLNTFTELIQTKQPTLSKEVADVILMESKRIAEEEGVKRLFLIKEGTIRP